MLRSPNTLAEQIVTKCNQYSLEMQIKHHSRPSYFSRSVHTFCLLACVAVLLVAVPSSAQQSGASAGAFDVSTKKRVVDLGPSPYYRSSSERRRLSCYFYPTLLVKTYDEGQKGAEWLSFVRVEEGHPRRCELAHDPDEHLVDPAEWGGYFKGVKGDLVFFDAPDGLDGAISFAAFNANTGKKVFEDSAYYPRIGNRLSPSNNLRIYAGAGGQVTLRYVRVEATECDLHSEPGKCWEAVRAQFDLKIARAPVCTGYSKIKDRHSSSIAYPVETMLFPNPATKTVSGPVQCRPVD
jgi:hypothetical protein